MTIIGVFLTFTAFVGLSWMLGATGKKTKSTGSTKLYRRIGHWAKP